MTTKNALVDMALATEFQLCVENENSLYPQRQAIEKSWYKKERAFEVECRVQGMRVAS